MRLAPIEEEEGKKESKKRIELDSFCFSFFWSGEGWGKNKENLLIIIICVVEGNIICIT